MKKGYLKILMMLVCTVLFMLGAETVHASAEIGTSAAVVTNLQAVYDEQNDRITLSYSMSGTDYVNISANGAVDGEKYTGTVYYFEDVKEGQTYNFKVEPYAYDAAGTPIRGTAAETTLTVGYKKAVLESIDVDYDLEQKVLVVDWSGENIACADVLQDSVHIAQRITGDRYLTTAVLEPKTKYVFTVAPYNAIGEPGAWMTYELTVEDYVAEIEEIKVSFDENTGKLQLDWKDVYTDYVEIYLNDEVLVENYKEKSFAYTCEGLQPGASYIVYVVPYNDKKEEGETYEEDISFGDFSVPDIRSVGLTNTDIVDSKGKNTGFCRPAAAITWEAYAKGIYEIYRAEKDKKSSYQWIANVTADVNGECTYTDSTVGIGKYYYKIRRTIKEDTYNDQNLFTALSDAEGVTVSLPKPTVTAVLDENAAVSLTVNSEKEYISGYEIYRKESKGKYKKIAVIAGSTYVDADVQFDKIYYYKVRSYFYNVKNGSITYGKYSSDKKIRTTVGAIEAKATQISANKIKLTWNAAANAQGYEIYCKSGTQGDSYALLTTTTNLEYTKKVSSGGSYSFMVKAYCVNEKGKTYFSASEVSCKAGLSGPKGLTVQKVTYKWKGSTHTLTENVTLAWDRVYGASGYYIEYYDTVTKKFKRLAKVKKSTTTSYTVSNEVKAEQQPIRYRIKAYSKDTQKIGETIDILPKLGQVKDVTVKTEQSKVSIRWKKVAGAEGYRVYRSNGHHAVLVGETTSKTSIKDSGLMMGVEYTYYVEAYNKTLKLTGDRSDPITYIATFEKVSSLKTENTTEGTVKLTWKAKADVKSYRIYYSAEKNGEYQLLKETKKTEYVHKNPVKGMDTSVDNTVYYRIVAVQVNGAGMETESNPATAKVKIKAATQNKDTTQK